MFSPWWQKGIRPSASGARRTPRNTARFLRRRPHVELLEDRLCPAPMTFTVTDTTDASATSLRAAITASNANAPGAGMFNTIDFAITGAGVQTISLLSALPAITQPVLIDGYSENNGTTQATANTLANADNAVLLIRLDGTGAGAGVDGLTLGAGSDGSTIKGLDVTNFTGNGIVVQSNGNSILGNFTGVNPTGTTRMPNGTFPTSGDGIRILNASNNQIGGTSPADRNIASGNAVDGIHVEGTLTAPATGNLIEGNFVGVAADGKSSVGNRTEPAPATGAAEGNNLFGIEISGGNGNTVGGPAAGARNVVGFNGAGIEVDNGGQNNIIQGNFSGVGADGVTPVANLLHGIVLRSSNGFGAPLGPAQANEPGVSNNLIGGTAAGDGNLVEFNGTAGIAIFGNPVSASGQPDVGNAIEGNSVFENGRNFRTASSAPLPLLGIDLTNGFVFPRDDGFTANDSKGHGAANDPNNFQNFPVLSSVTVDSGGTHISGSLTQAISPNTTFRVEFFASNPDPLGLPAEGQAFLGFKNVTTNASGVANFSVTLPASAPGRIVTATATDPSGNTSEFSPGLAIPMPPTPAPPPVVPPPVLFRTKGSARGTRVFVFDARTGALLFSFVPFRGFHGRVHVAAGDVNDDGVLDAIAGSGPGGPGRVVVVDGRTHAVLDSFPPVGASFRRDVVVAAADVNRDGFADVLVVRRKHRGATAEVFDGKALARGQVVLLGTMNFGA
jgi:hypothetical protein